MEIRLIINNNEFGFYCSSKSISLHITEETETKFNTFLWIRLEIFPKLDLWTDGIWFNSRLSKNYLASKK